MYLPLLKSILMGLMVTSLGGPVFAQSQKTDIRPNAKQITGDKLRSQFSGVTHKGAYNFTDDGKPQRFYIETHSPNGEVVYDEGFGREKGIWFIKGHKLCFDYESDYMPGGCFRVYGVKNCFYYYVDRIPKREDELDRDYWTARSVKAGETPACDAPMV